MLTQTMMQTLLLASLQTFAPSLAVLVSPEQPDPEPVVPAEITARIEQRDQIAHAVDAGRRRQLEQQRIQQANVQISELQAEVTALQQQVSSLCVWEHERLDGEVVTTVLPLDCSEHIRSRSARIVSTAYYSPLKGQKSYATGSLDGDRRLNGQGVQTADGTAPYMGTVAAPAEYSFGTQLYLEGFGAGKVHDRGGAIKRQQGHDRIDLWMGEGDEGLQRSREWGIREHEAAVFVSGSPEDIEQVLADFMS
jgi:3D (Asp-Asp-Asp) domain-containing protein